MRLLETQSFKWYFFRDRRAVTTVWVLFLFSAVSSYAQTVTNRSLQLTQIDNTDQFKKADPAYRFCSLSPGVTLASLYEKGIVPAQVIDDNTVIVKTSAAEKAGSLLRQTRAVNLLWKLSSNVSSKDFNLIKTYVIKSSDPQKLAATLEDAKIKTDIRGQLVLAYAKLSTIFSHVSLDPDVTYIGLESLTPQEESQVLDLYLGPNKINKLHHEMPAYNGEGIVISLKERLYNTSDIDIINRHIPSSLASPDTTSHATDMATIAAGAGNSFITGRGVATHALLTSSSFANIFPDKDEDFKSLNAYVQNHSYGTVVENFYGALAAAYDESTNNNKTIVHVFSAGNAGTGNATSGPYMATPGFSNLTGNSKMAKNVLVVGAVDTTGVAIPFASRGPAHDGRIKPEVVAFSSAGTSNTAAMVSGLAAVLQQVYKEQKGAYPPSALLKALLINSSEDVGEPGLDFVTGFGNINAFRCVQNLQQSKYFESEIGSNGINTFDLSIPANAMNLKITLVWNDPPAPVNSAKALVNNLDLELMTPDGIIRPWVLNSNGSIESLTAPAVRGVDLLNNVEQVTLSNVEPGTYSIAVKSTSVTKGPQQFYVAYQWDEAESFEWTFPTASDNFPYNGETGTYFYWRSTLTQPVGTLEVSIDGGLTWTVIADKLNLSKGSYRWENPFEQNTTAVARMRVNSEDFYTDEFTISRTLIPSVGFNCADTALLQWSAFEDIIRYRIDALKPSERYMQSLRFENDTASVVSNAESKIFAIQPIHSSGKPLLRSPAVDVENFGAGCFESSLVDEAVTVDGIQLKLELGTTYAVNEIIFEIKEQGSFKTLSAIKPLTPVIKYFHSKPPQGTVTYRARILLSNGQEIITELLKVFYLTEIPFAVFPNPISISEDINIFSGKFPEVNFKFHLFKTDGTLVRSAQIVSDRESVSTVGLSPGLYIYRIEGAAQRFSGKILLK